MANGIQKILLLAPHTDDGELGCGGAAARFIREGKEVFCAAFSWAEQSVPAGLPGDILKREFRSAAETLGLKERNTILFDYPVRNFPQYRQAILDDLLKLKKEIGPDLVMIPSSFDVHQDHQVLSQEGLRAFKASASIFGYELPWNNLTFNTEVFIVFEKDDLSKKISALSRYESQKDKFYMTGDFMVGLAKLRGSQASASGFAESFQVLRGII